MTPHVRWTVEARRKLWPRRELEKAINPRIHKPGLFAELSSLGKAWSEKPGSTHLFSKDFEPFRELRRLLAEAAPDVYEGALEIASKMRLQANLPLRCALSFVFPGQCDWSRADALDCLSSLGPEGPPECAHLLFLSLSDADLCIRLFKAYPEPAERIAFSIYSIEWVLSLGPPSHEIIASIFDDAVALGDTRLGVRRCLHAMELIRSPEAAAFFARRLQYNDVRVFAVRYFQSEPALALYSLAPCAAGRGKAAQAAKTILMSVLSQHEAWVNEVWPELAEPVRKVIQPLLASRALPVSDAPPGKLPEVLVKPHWRHKSMRRLRVIEDVPVRDLRPQIEPSQHDVWVNKINWVPNSLVFSPRVALAVVHAWMHRPEVRDAADAWIQTFMNTAVIGLIPAAVGKPGSARMDAGRMLRLLVRRGPETAMREMIRKEALIYGSDVASIVEDVLSMDPLWDCPETAPKLGEFIRIEALPRPCLAGDSAQVLPLSAVMYVCEMLVFSSEDFPYAGISAVKSICDPASLSRFAEAILSAWQAAGALLRIAWPLNAIAELGGDSGARTLSPMIRSWLYEGDKDRAFRGIDTLARIGTDVALMHLSAIAERSRYLDVKERAKKKIAAVAQKRGLSAEELFDRIVPELDLDADLSRVLDYGSRSFRVGFDAHFEPYVREEQGSMAVLAALPKPLKADDPKKALAAQEIWKALREDMAAIAKSQAARLEDAMVSQRRFKADLFQSVFVGHRLLLHLVRRLLWGMYSPEGELISTFRICEDKTPADEHDEVMELDLNANIGIPHPIELNDGLRHAWGSLFSDYEIVQPFAQIGREVFKAQPAELPAHELTRYSETVIPTGKLFGLEYKGFSREYAYDGGPVIAYRKHIAGTPYYARLSFSPGMIPAEAISTPEQTIDALELFRADHLFPRPSLGELSAVVFSELVRDVDGLCRGG